MKPHSVVLKTVKAPAYIDYGERKTPRLSVVVRYTRGGISSIDGKDHPRGYELAVCYDIRGDDGSLSFAVDEPDPSVLLQPAKSFSHDVLTRHVLDAQDGKHDQTISSLYSAAVNNRRRHAWTSDILPL